MYQLLQLHPVTEVFVVLMKAMKSGIQVVQVPFLLSLLFSLKYKDKKI